MKFRPHILRYVIKATGHDDENGNFVVDTQSALSDPILCRWIPNGAGSSLRLPDENGGVQVYSYTIILDLQEHDFRYGDLVRWVDSNDELLEEKAVLKYHRYQTYAKIWV